MTNKTHAAFVAALFCGVAALSAPAFADTASTVGTKGAMGNTAGADTASASDTAAPRHHHRVKSARADNASEMETTKQLNQQQAMLSNGSSSAATPSDGTSNGVVSSPSASGNTGIPSVDANNPNNVTGQHDAPGTTPAHL